MLSEQSLNSSHRAAQPLSSVDSVCRWVGLVYRIATGGRKATLILAPLEDIPAIEALMKSERGFWQDSWRDDVLERGIAASGGLAFVWEESGSFPALFALTRLGFPRVFK